MSSFAENVKRAPSASCGITDITPHYAFFVRCICEYFRNIICASEDVARSPQGSAIATRIDSTQGEAEV